MSHPYNSIQNVFDIPLPPPPPEVKDTVELFDIFSDEFFGAPPPPPPESDFEVDFPSHTDLDEEDTPQHNEMLFSSGTDSSKTRQRAVAESFDAQSVSRGSLSMSTIRAGAPRVSLVNVDSLPPSSISAAITSNPHQFSTDPGRLTTREHIHRSNTTISDHNTHTQHTQAKPNQSHPPALYSGPVPAAWVAQQLHLRAGETASTAIPLSIVCCSWNVNGKKPSPNDSLDEWLTPLRQRVAVGMHHNTPSGSSPSLSAPADMVIVSFQEIVDLSAKNLLTDPNVTGRWEEKISAILENALRTYLCERGESWDEDELKGYHLLASTHLVGLAMCVWVRCTLLPHVSNVKTGKVGVGIMGVGGNKGAVGVSFCMADTSLCFLNAHIAAHQHKVKDRNAHYHTILRRFKFDVARPLKLVPGTISSHSTFEPLPLVSLSGVYSTNSTIHHVQRQAQQGGVQGLSELGVMDHDHVVWMGDLNYRLAHPDMDKVHQKIELKDIPYLLHYDQLLTEKKGGRAFAAFKELPIEFLPTYKYAPGTHSYERRPNKKLRMPSWCDRIQWRSTNPTYLTPVEYSRSELTLSDHKPVRLSFGLIVHEQSRKKRNEMMLHLKRQSGISVLPRLELSWSGLHWPQVRFNMPLTYMLTVTNPGMGAVRFIASVCAYDDMLLQDSLLREPSSATLTPEPVIDTSTCHEKRGKVGMRTHEDPITNLWLTVTPTTGLLGPGEAMNLSVTVLVRGLEGHRCNLGQLPLQGRVVVRAQDACIRQWNEEIGPSEVGADEQIHVDSQQMGSLECASDSDDDDKSNISVPTNVQSSLQLSGGQRALNKIKSIFSSNHDDPETLSPHNTRPATPDLMSSSSSLQDMETTGPTPAAALMHNYSAPRFWTQQSRPVEYFCKVTARYLPSVAGSSLMHLLSLQGPLRSPNQLNSYALVRRISIQQVAQRARAGSVQWSASLVPKEVVYLIEAAVHHHKQGALHCSDMFQSALRNPNEVAYDSSGLLNTALAPIDPIHVMRVRDILDTCPHLLTVAITKYDIPLLALGHALLDLLNGLAEPILPPSIAVPMSPNGDFTDWCKKLLLDLSSHQYNLFMYLMAFLRALIDPIRTSKTKLSAQALAILFAKPFTHAADPGKPFNEAQPKSSLHIIYHLLKLNSFPTD